MKGDFRNAKDSDWSFTYARTYLTLTVGRNLKLGIHLRQRHAEVLRGSLSLASVDDAMNYAICLRGCCNPSHQLLVHQSEASPKNSPPHAQYGWNMPHLAEIKKHSLVLGMAYRGPLRMPHLPLSLVYSWLNAHIAEDLQYVYFGGPYFGSFKLSMSHPWKQLSHVEKYSENFSSVDQF